MRKTTSYLSTKDQELSSNQIKDMCAMFHHTMLIVVATLPFVDVAVVGGIALDDEAGCVVGGPMNLSAELLLFVCWWGGLDV